MLIILFGLAASGKNYVGQTIADAKNYFFYDGDALLSPDMMDFIRDKKPFTQAMRDGFTQRMIDKMIELKKSHQNIVFAQALYKEKNREQLLQAFPEAKFILIQSTQKNIASRLKRRNDWIDEEYARLMQQHFDTPQLPHTVIQNNAGSAEILPQIAVLF